jgi:hypothetical protein
MTSLQFGYYVGGFILSFLLGYIFLRIAGTKPGKGFFRLLAVAIPVILFFIGGFNPGSLVAAVLLAIGAVRQVNKIPKAASPE